MPLDVVSHSEAQSAALAAMLAEILKPGDVVFLIGQLGTGKTFFIRHAAIALGVREPVTSPSYTMAQTYAGNLRIHHLDLYRLPGFNAEDAIDFEPFFEEDAITFVEWPEEAEAFIEKPVVIIRLEHIDISSRRFSFEFIDRDQELRLEKMFADPRL